MPATLEEDWHLQWVSQFANSVVSVHRHPDGILREEHWALGYGGKRVGSPVYFYYHEASTTHHQHYDYDAALAEAQKNRWRPLS